MFKARGIMFSARKTDTLAVFIFDFYMSCEHIAQHRVRCLHRNHKGLLGLRNVKIKKQPHNSRLLNE